MDKTHGTESNEYINVDYENMTNDLESEPTYYRTGQVAKIIDEPSSTVRHWSNEYDEILNIETDDNGNRKYTKDDIEELFNIKMLAREREYTAKQIKEYYANLNKEEKSIQKTQDIILNQIKEEISQQISKEISLQINEFVKLIQTNQEAMSKQIISEVEKKISNLQDNINLKIDNVNVTLEKQNSNIEEDIKLVQELKDKLEENKEMFEKEKEKRQKGFWKRIFSK